MSATRCLPSCSTTRVHPHSAEYRLIQIDLRSVQCSQASRRQGVHPGLAIRRFQRRITLSTECPKRLCLALLAVCALPTGADVGVAAWRRAGRPGTVGAERQPAGRSRVPRRPRPRRPARRCGSPASASASSRARAAWQRWYAAVGMTRWGSRCGTRRRGRCSAPPTPAPSCSWPGADATPGRSCWRSAAGAGCRRTSAPRSASSASCAASGWTAPAAGLAGGLRRRRCARADCPRLKRLSEGIRFEEVVFTYPGTEPPGARERRPRPAGGLGRGRRR